MRASDDRRYLAHLVVRSEAKTTIDLYAQDVFSGAPARLIAAKWKIRFIRSLPGERDSPTSWQAPNKRLVAIDLDAPDRANWREVVRIRAPITDFAVRDGRIFVSCVENIATRRMYTTCLAAKSASFHIRSLEPRACRTTRWTAMSCSTRSTHSPIRTLFTLIGLKQVGTVWSRRKATFDRASIEVSRSVSSKDGALSDVSGRSKRPPTDRRGSDHSDGYGGFGKSVTPQFSAFATSWSSAAVYSPSPTSGRLGTG